MLSLGTMTSHSHVLSIPWNNYLKLTLICGSESHYVSIAALHLVLFRPVVSARKCYSFLSCIEQIIYVYQIQPVKDSAYKFASQMSLLKKKGLGIKDLFLMSVVCSVLCVCSCMLVSLCAVVCLFLCVQLYACFFVCSCMLVSLCVVVCLFLCVQLYACFFVCVVVCLFLCVQLYACCG